MLNPDSIPVQLLHSASYAAGLGLGYNISLKGGLLRPKLYVPPQPTPRPAPAAVTLPGSVWATTVESGGQRVSSFILSRKPPPCGQRPETAQRTWRKPGPERVRELPGSHREGQSCLYPECLASGHRAVCPPAASPSRRKAAAST